MTPAGADATWDSVGTSRLALRRVTHDDVDELFALHADPDVWTHHPAGRHETTWRTARMVQTFVEAWDVAGLGVWTARLPATGELVGTGGCTLRADALAWNLYYRFVVAHQRQGYAAELGAAALAAAAAHRPDLPVVASLLEHNAPSRRLAERLGLERVFAGPDRAGEGVRLLYADRPVTDEVVDAVRGTGPTGPGS